jgi:hypothetical protein
MPTWREDALRGVTVGLLIFSVWRCFLEGLFIGSDRAGFGGSRRRVVWMRRSVQAPMAVADRRRHATAIIAAMLSGLKGFEDHFPWHLSGGMQQRASLCRALMRPPVNASPKPSRATAHDSGSMRVATPSS